MRPAPIPVTLADGKEGLRSLSNVIKCEPYACSVTYLACAERHAKSYASHHVTSMKRHIGALALCHPCIEGRDRMQELGLVPVERLARSVKMSRRKALDELPYRR